jgi:biotin synthase
MHPALAAARHTLLTLRRPLGREELTAVSDVPDADVEALLELASDVRDHFCGARAYVEVIYNAKKGGCSEDCHFCSQSARFATDVDPEPLRTVDDFVAAARAALERGAGVDKVNHNLESSRRFFPSVCTTHSYDERFETCLRVKRAGLELCCGGIIGMGETDADRIDFLCALQELEPAEVPINFLDPRPGTPFADRSVMEPMAALRYVALARLALPRALIRFAGGREITLRGLQDLGMQSGASGLILGNYLTTKGREDREDFAMLDRLGFEVMR